jgi:enoyl-[acyl-carrier protein] reductase III
MGDPRFKTRWPRDLGAPGLGSQDICCAARTRGILVRSEHGAAGWFVPGVRHDAPSEIPGIVAMREKEDINVVVTGGSRGIGRAIAARLGGPGDRVIVNYLRDRDAADAVCQGIVARGGRAWSVQADVRSPDALKTLVDASREHLGGVDVLVHNAAIGALKPMEMLKLGHWDLTIESSLRPFWYLTRLMLPLLREGGSVIGLSSLGSRRYTPGYIAMGAAKGGLEAMTRQLAVELAPRIRVNTVCGGLVRTDALAAFPDGDRLADEVEAMTPSGRLVEPEDLAAAVAFLASASARAITGQILTVDGGFSVR